MFPQKRKSGIKWRLCFILAFGTISIFCSHPSLSFPNLMALSDKEIEQNHHSLEADNLSQKGIEQFAQGELKQALQTFEKALVIYRQQKNPLKEAQTLNHIGEIYYELLETSQVFQVNAQQNRLSSQLIEKQAIAESERLNLIAQNNSNVMAHSLARRGMELIERDQFTQGWNYLEQAMRADHLLNFSSEKQIAQNDQAISEENPSVSFPNSVNLSESVKAEVILRDFLGTITRSQQAYHFEKQEFASDFKLLGLVIPSNIAYQLTIITHGKNQVTIVAKPNKEGFSSLTKNLMYDPQKSSYTWETCIAVTNPQVPPIPQFEEGQIICPDGALDEENYGRQVAQNDPIALSRLATKQSQNGQYQEALANLHKALAIYQVLDYSYRQGGILVQMGMIYRQLGDNQKALDYLQKALSLFREDDDRYEEAETLGFIGIIYRELGDNQKALDYSQKALVIFQEEDYTEEEATILRVIALLYRELGETQKALDYYQQALPLVQEIGDSMSEASTLSNIGHLYDDLEQTQKALVYYQKALPIFQQIGDRNQEANTLANIGLIYSELEDKQKALEYLEKALPIFQEIGDRNQEAGMLIIIAVIANIFGEQQTSLSYFQQALNIVQDIKDNEQESMIIAFMGVVYGELGQKQKALDYFQQAVIVSQKLSDQTGEEENSLYIDDTMYEDLKVLFSGAMVALYDQLTGSKLGIYDYFQQYLQEFDQELHEHIEKKGISLEEQPKPVSLSKVLVITESQQRSSMEKDSPSHYIGQVTDSTENIVNLEETHKPLRGHEDKTLDYFQQAQTNERMIAQGQNSDNQHYGAVRTVAITSDGKTVISGSRDGTIKAWNLNKGELIRTYIGHRAWVRDIAITPDGKTLVSGDDDGVIRVWNLETAEILRTLGDNFIYHLTITPDGNKIVNCAFDQELNQIIQVWDLVTGKLVNSLKEPNCNFIVAPDSRTLIGNTGKDKIYFWDLTTGEVVKTLTDNSQESIDAFAISPNGEILVTSTNKIKIKIWNLKTEQVVSSFVSNYEGVAGLQDLVISPDGKLLISAGDKELKIWDLPRGNLQKTLVGHTRTVWTVAVSPDGKMLVSGSSDRTLRIWDVTTGNLVNTLSKPVEDKTPEEVIAILDEQTEKIATQKKNADSLLELAQSQILENLFQEASESLEEALKIYQEINDIEGEQASLISLGLVNIHVGQYQQAIEYLQQSLEIAQGRNDQINEGMSLTFIGLAYNWLGKYQVASENLERALAIHQKTNDTNMEGYTLAFLGDSYNFTSNYEEAIKYGQQSLEIANQLNNQALKSTALSVLGSAYTSLGEPKKGIESLNQSLQISTETNHIVGKAKALGHLANIYYTLSQYPQGIEYYNQTLKIAQQIGNKRTEADALAGLGLIYSALGQYEKSREYSEQSFAIFQQLNDPLSQVVALGNIGLAYSNLQAYQSAIEYYQNGLVILEEISMQTRGSLEPLDQKASLLANLGQVYGKLEQHQKAIDYQKQSLEIARKIDNKRSQAYNLAMLGNSYFLIQNNRKAIEYFQESVAIAQQIEDITLIGFSKANIGAVLNSEGKYFRSQKILYDALNSLESVRTYLSDQSKISIIDTQTLVYRNLQIALIAQNKIEEALEISERGRARAFIELLASNISDNSPRRGSGSTKPPTIEKIKQIASAQNAILVEYSLIPEYNVIYIWIVKPTGEIALETVPLDRVNVSLSKLVTATRKSMGVGDRNRTTVTVIPTHKPTVKSEENLKQLYQLLIAPIADLLPTNPREKVIFVPQDSLFLVPFAALQDDEGTYLIEKHTLLTAPSIQVLDLTHQTRSRDTKNKGKYLIVGNPTMPSISLEVGKPPQQLSSLVGAKTEAQQIAAILGTQPLIGNQATKSAVIKELPNATIIHLATHGLLEYGTPEVSGLKDVPGAIALAPDVNFQPELGKINGLLTASEILDLQLNADLVVLSACDTGRGDITADGVIGLSRSLITAGAKSVIVSLWSVPDAPTAELMTEFYRQWEQTGDKAEALRQTMLKTLEKHPEPKDWAAFTLIGEAQ